MLSGTKYIIKFRWSNRLIIRLLTLLFFSIAPASHALDIGVAAVFKNEAPYILEWIEYHRLIGVKHFWLYNHYSSDNYREVLKDFILEGVVELVDLDCEHDGRVRDIQPVVYKDAIQRAKNNMDWLAIIDLDEFILPMKEKNLQSTIKKHFHNASLIYVNWRQFGTSGKHLSAGQKQISNLTACSLTTHPRNAVGKCIVKLNDAVDAKLWSPHFCPVDGLVYYGDGSLFDGDGKPFTRLNDLRTDGKHHDMLIRINHYFTRDETFWSQVKLPRIEKRGENTKIYLEQYHSSGATSDTKIITFLKKNYPKFWRSKYEENKI